MPIGRYGRLKATYSVAETVDLLSVGRTSVSATTERGDLTPIEFGRKTLISAATLDDAEPEVSASELRVR